MNIFAITQRSIFSICVIPKGIQAISSNLVSKATIHFNIKILYKNMVLLKILNLIFENVDCFLKIFPNLF